MHVLNSDNNVPTSCENTVNMGQVTLEFKMAYMSIEFFGKLDKKLGNNWHIVANISQFSGLIFAKFS